MIAFTRPQATRYPHADSIFPHDAETVTIAPHSKPPPARTAQAPRRRPPWADRNAPLRDRLLAWIGAAKERGLCGTCSATGESRARIMDEVRALRDLGLVRLWSVRKGDRSRMEHRFALVLQ
jgi:hypothetical protein